MDPSASNGRGSATCGSASAGRATAIFVPAAVSSKSPSIEPPAGSRTFGLRLGGGSSTAAQLEPALERLALVLALVQDEKERTMKVAARDRARDQRAALELFGQRQTREATETQAGHHRALDGFGLR